MRPISVGLVLFNITLLLSSCSIKCEIGKEATTERPSAQKVKGTEISNGIRLSTHGVKVEEAYLVHRDEKGEPVDEDNVVDPEKGVKLILIIDEGWKVMDNRSWLGASLRVSNEQGEIVLQEDDLFNNRSEDGLDATDALVLALSVYFTNEKAKESQTYQVHFRVWDKKSDASLEGDYKIYTR